MPANPPPSPAALRPVSPHWADQVADRLVRARPNKTRYTLAAGITPSGTVHIGNFREVITVDLVARALGRLGKPVRFIFSWDDFDVFRKLPANMPPALKSFLGKPLGEVPSPEAAIENASATQTKKRGSASYSDFHEKQFEAALQRVGVRPEFIYQARQYQSGAYTAAVQEALQNRQQLKTILNPFRSSPLPADWLPISVYCGECSSANTALSDYQAEAATLVATCRRCGRIETIALKTAKTSKRVKLLWRIDWPMRWRHEQVDFEPGGKDHSSEGGSYDTAKQIAERVFHYPPPLYQRYDFVLIKTDERQTKMSSSAGQVITLDDLLEVYEPQLVRWLFASYKCNVDFTIGLGLDALKCYEAYDRLERQYYGVEPASAKQLPTLRRIYELSQLEEISPDSTVDPAALPFQPAFRHLANVLQLYEGGVEKNWENIKNYYQPQLRTDADVARLKIRALLAEQWLLKYAPPEFKFALRRSPLSPALQAEVPPGYRAALAAVKEALLARRFAGNDRALSEFLYDTLRRNALENQTFFRLTYQRLLGRNEGPRLAAFLNLLDRETVQRLL